MTRLCFPKQLPLGSGPWWVFPGVASPLKVLMREDAPSSVWPWACWGVSWHLQWPEVCHTSIPHLGSSSLLSCSPSLPPSGPCRFPWGDSIGGSTPSLLAILVWRASSTSHRWSSSRFNISQVSSAWGIGAWASDSPSSRLGMPRRGQVPAPLPWTCIWAPDLGLLLMAMYSLTSLPYRDRIWSKTGLPHQTVAAVRWCVTAIMSDLCKNTSTTLVSESQSTPSGCSWPNPMHSSTRFSSLKELGFNGMPLP